MLKSFRPTIEDILSTNAVIVNDLRRHEDQDIAAESKDLRSIWKRCVEEREMQNDKPVVQRAPTKKVTKPTGSTQLFSAIKGAVPVTSSSSRNSSIDIKPSPSLTPMFKQTEQEHGSVDEKVDDTHSSVDLSSVFNRGSLFDILDKFSI